MSLTNRVREFLSGRPSNGDPPLPGSSRCRAAEHGFSGPDITTAEALARGAAKSPQVIASIPGKPT
jgi:hypothetical protein